MAKQNKEVEQLKETVAEQQKVITNMQLNQKDLELKVMQLVDNDMALKGMIDDINKKNQQPQYYG